MTGSLRITTLRCGTSCQTMARRCKRGEKIANKSIKTQILNYLSHVRILPLQISTKIFRPCRARRAYDEVDRKVKREIIGSLAASLAHCRKTFPEDFPHSDLLQWPAEAWIDVHFVGTAIRTVSHTRRLDVWQ